MGDKEPVPFTVAPVRSDDPSEPEKPKDHSLDNVAKAKAELKADTDELVRSPRTPTVAVRGGAFADDSLSNLTLLPSSISQSEEDAALKGELEMLVERLKVCSYSLSIPED